MRSQMIDNNNNTSHLKENKEGERERENKGKLLLLWKDIMLNKHYGPNLEVFFL